MRRTTSRALSLVSLSWLALIGCAAHDDDVLVHVPTGVSASTRILEPDAAAPRDATEPAPLRETTAPPVSPSLMMLADGETAVVADPDTDRVYTVALDTRSVTRTIDLPRGVEPGRLVEDGAGRVHVVLRRGGGIISLAPESTSYTLRETCAAPRGIDYRASDDALIVACAEGQVVVLPAAGGDATQRIELDDDLRDVVVQGDRVLVSRFRSAEVLALDASGAVVARYRPASVERVDALARRPDPDLPSYATFTPEVAWRMIPAGRDVWLLHQRARVTPIAETARGITYGSPSLDPSGDCSFGLVESAVSTIGPDQPSGELAPSRPLTTPLATDVAVRPPSSEMIVPPSDGPEILDLGPCAVVPTESVATPGAAVAHSSVHGLVRAEGHPLTVTWADAGARVAVELTAEPDWTDADIGRSIFQSVQPSRIACASCHPEGGDDGHVWTQGSGVALRTQTVQGRILGTAPFHWEGDMPTFGALVNEVLVGRMRGAPLHPARAAAFAAWVDGLDAPPRPDSDPAAIDRGRALFESPARECTMCHRGPSYTTGDTVDVGTGGSFQVPALRGVAYRAPYMHSGCATTLRERFTASADCNGGDAHGHVSDLTQNEIDDLVTYLRSL